MAEQRIKIRTDGGTYEISAYAVDQLALHENWVGYGYTVTHIPTGLLIAKSLEKNKAEQLLKDINALDLDLSKMTAEDIKNKNIKYRPLAELALKARGQADKINQWPTE